MHCTKKNKAPTVRALTAAAVLLLVCGCSTGVSRQRAGIDTGRQDIVTAARSRLGTPYRMGGADPRGFDCSGFICWVYRQVYGISLPHRAAELYKRGRTVRLRDAVPGDLIFFSGARKGVPAHAGIYLGSGRFIHSTSSRGVVETQMSRPYYRNRLICLKRIILNE